MLLKILRFSVLDQTEPHNALCGQKYPSHPVVRALGPERIRCSNPVPSYPIQIYIIMTTLSNPETQNAQTKGEIILYQTADGKTNIDVKLENETVW